MTSAVPTVSYNLIKDLFLFFRSRERHIQHLGDNLDDLISDLITIKSRVKHHVVDVLESSTTKTVTSEYKVLKKKIEKIERRTKKFIGKYRELVEGSDLNSLIAGLDDSTAETLLDDLERKKPKILTKNICKLANLDIDVLWLKAQATMVLDRLKAVDNLIVDRAPEDSNPPVINRNLPTEIEGDMDKVSRLLENRRSVVGSAGQVGISDTLATEMSRQRLITVGITGPVQIGKTTVMKMLKNRFTKSVYATYPNEFASKDQVVEMQRRIMREFKMKDAVTDNAYENAKTIAEFLEGKEYILLMDDVSSDIKLENLGILKQHIGRVVIASRSKNVVKKLADAGHVVEIHTLTNKDARALFDKIHGEVDSKRNQEKIDRIVELCGGVPEVIKLVATHLKSCCETEADWDNVKSSLQSDVNSVDLGLTIFSPAYNMMFDNLENHMKSCLLFGALFPSNVRLHKDYLIECWKAEEFIGKYKGFWESRKDGNLVLRKLMDTYLLIESSDDERFVMMPASFRRLAIKMDYPGEGKPVIWFPENREELKDHIWNTATRLSLITHESVSLPTSPQCEKLRTLLMRQQQLKPESAQLMRQQYLKPESLQLSGVFFEQMTELQLLDLQITELHELPVSVEMLRNLRYLYLTECGALKNLPSEFGKLTLLELLDISKTGISSLPMEIKSLVSLRCLRATLSPKRCTPNSKGKEVEGSGSIIPPNIIVELQMLEELSIDIDDTFEGWENSVDQTIVNEIASLQYLNTLRYKFPNMESFCNFVKSSKSLENKGKEAFRSFEISVGSCKLKRQYSSQELEERRLRFSQVEDSFEHLSAILSQTKKFELEGAPNVKCLSKLNLTGIDVCVIENCKKLEYVVNSKKIHEIDTKSDVLGFMKKLHLYDLHSLLRIWKGPISGNSLNQLTELTLHGCTKLTKILDLQLALALIKLKNLEVENCSNISVLIEVPRGQGSRRGDNRLAPFKILSKLETIKLSGLPGLQSICESTLIWESLTTMFIKECDKLGNWSTLVTASLKFIHCDGTCRSNIGTTQMDTHFGRRLGDIAIVHHDGESSTSSVSLNPNPAPSQTNQVLDSHAETDDNQLLNADGDNATNNNEEYPSARDHNSGFCFDRLFGLRWNN